MQNNVKPIRLVLHGLFWLALLGGQVVTGLHGLGSAFDHTPKAASSDTYSGSDSFLGPVLGVPDGSRKLLDAFAKLPPRSPVVVLWPKVNVNAVLGAQLVAYLEWPRPVWSEPIDARLVDGASNYFNKPPLAARVYFLLKLPKPAPGSNSTTVGRMTIMPVVQNNK